jgi:hypothetical protein
MKTHGLVLKSREMSDKQDINQINCNRTWSDTHRRDSKEIAVEREEWIHMPQNKNKVHAYDAEIQTQCFVDRAS